MTTTTEEIHQTLSDMPMNMVLTGQCASLCSLFISGAYISATVNELVDELNKRHKGMVNVEEVLETAQHALDYGVVSGVFEKENNKYTPTESGWFIGRDWDRKLRLGWNG